MIKNKLDSRKIINMRINWKCDREEEAGGEGSSIDWLAVQRNSRAIGGGRGENCISFLLHECLFHTSK